MNNNQGKIYFCSGSKHIDSPKPKMQAFIFNWPKTSHRVSSLYKRLKECKFIDDLFIINSDEQYEDPEVEGCINLPEDSFFSAQFHAALKIFDGDIMFHIQADADIPETVKIDELFSSASYYYNELNFSIYAPDIDHTAWNNEKSQLPAESIRFLGYPTRIVPIINSDCTCWFINKTIIKLFKNSQLLKNLLNYSPLGWGASAAICALGWQNKMPVIRDLNYLIFHPNETGYEKKRASNQYRRFIGSIDNNLFVRDYLISSIQDKSKINTTALIYRRLLDLD
jgi:hypothetical protein